MEYEEIQEILGIRIWFLEGVLSVLYSSTEATGAVSLLVPFLAWFPAAPHSRKGLGWCVLTAAFSLVIFPFLSDLISDNLDCWCFHLLSFIQQDTKIRSWLWFLYVTDRDSKWPRAASFSSNCFIFQQTSAMWVFFMYPLESWGEVLRDHAWIYSYS